MAKLTEKRLYLVPPQPFIADGDQFGKVTITDTSKFVVGHIVVLTSSTQSPQILKVKRIISSTIMFVGPEKEPIQNRSDISAFLVADTASVQASEQNRPNVPEQEIERNTYDEEPRVARRVSLIDEIGDHYGEGNPFPVEATIVPSTIDTPIIFNVSASVAGTEYSQLLPDDTARFKLRARNTSKLQVAYVVGTTSTNFLTIMPGNIYEEEGVRLTGKTVFFQSSKNDTIVEILAWT